MTSRIPERAIQIGVAVILIVAPLPFGSVQDRWIFFIEAGVCFLALLWVVARIAAGEIRFDEHSIAWSLCAVAAYVLLTLVPVPEAILSVISSESARAYQAAAKILPEAGAARFAAFPITVDRFETEGELLKLIAYAAFFFLVVNSFRRRREFLTLYCLLIAMGTVLAALGIAQSVWSNGRIYWKYESGSGTHFGPFVNHNHFAAYIELPLGLCIGMLLAEISEFRRRFAPAGFAGHLSWLWHKDGGRPWLLLFPLFVMLSSLAASLSRGGVLSFFVTCLVFGSAAVLSPRNRPAAARGAMRHRILFAAFGLAAILLFAGLVILTPRGYARWLEASDRAAQSRIQIWRDAGRALSDFPLTGAGLGSFRSIYPRYKSGNFSSETTHAENEYLQWAVETGAVGFVLMLLAALAFWRRVLSRLRSRCDPGLRFLACGALFGITCLAVHNCFDFNTHIPSNSITLAAAAALSLIAVRTHRGNGQDDDARIRIPSRKAGGLVILAATAVAALLMGMRALSRYESLSAQDQWANARPPVTDPAGAGPQIPLLDHAAARSPANHRARYLMATAFESAALEGGLFEYSRRRKMLLAAQAGISGAIRNSPATASYWGALGRIADKLADHRLADEAFEQALRLGRTNGYIHRDYGASLVLRGNVREGAARFVLARSYSAGIGLQPLLEMLASRTGDTELWRSIVRYQPDDLRVYADFLRSRGLSDAGAQVLKEAEALEQHPLRPQ